MKLQERTPAEGRPSRRKTIRAEIFAASPDHDASYIFPPVHLLELGSPFKDAFVISAALARHYRRGHTPTRCWLMQNRYDRHNGVGSADGPPPLPPRFAYILRIHA